MRLSRLRQTVELSKQLGKNEKSLIIPSDVVGVCCAAYWSQLWIIQEIFSARELVVCCGPIQFRWEQIVESPAAVAADSNGRVTVKSPASSEI
jgi:hypothetical protein